MIPTPQEIAQEIPLLPQEAAFISSSRSEIEAILTGIDSRLLLIVGPCSLHDSEAALEYGRRFKQLAERVSDQIYMVMRAYVEKPRTILGWKGMLYDPDLDGSYDLAQGIKKTRRLFSDLTALRVPLGCELLEVLAAPYYSEFLSWGCIGARTSASSSHRQLASQLSFPIGFKNTTDGNIDIAIHAILAAASPHVCLGFSTQGQVTRVETKGNLFGHIVMRGGSEGPNYYREDVQKTLQGCEKAGIRTHLIIDCSHDNCGKNYRKQLHVFEDVLQQILEGNRRIVGMMLESHLKAGSQPLQDKLNYGVSITDPCLDWESTKKLIEETYAQLQQSLPRKHKLASFEANALI